MLRLTEEQVNTLNESVQNSNHRYNIISDSADDQNPPTFVVVSSHYDTFETLTTDKIIFLCTKDDQNQCVSEYWPRVTTPELISDDLKSGYINKLEKLDIKIRTNTNINKETKLNLLSRLSTIQDKISELNIDEIDTINDSINILDKAISNNFGIDQNINFMSPVGNSFNPNMFSNIFYSKIGL